MISVSEAFELIRMIVINGGANKANPIIKTMQPQTSTGIVCKDIRQVLDIGNNNSKGL
jgi:hypothetical protein